MKKILMVFGILLLAHMVMAQADTAAAQEASSIVCDILSNIKLFFMLIAAGVAIVIITINGIKWIGSSDDPGARKQAKEGIIHAVVGLIIVLIAVNIVSLVMTGEECITSY